MTFKYAARFERCVEHVGFEDYRRVVLKLRKYKRKSAGVSVAEFNNFVGNCVQSAIGRKEPAHNDGLAVKLAKAESV